MSEVSLETYQQELFQDVALTSSSAGIYKEEAFFDVVTDRLVEAGEFDVARYSYYRPSRGGIRVDGNCGDPLLDYPEGGSGSHSLGLIILDFEADESPKNLTQKEMDADFGRVLKFALEACRGRFWEEMEETDPGYELADMVSKRWNSIDQIKFYLITNRRLSKNVTGKDASSYDGKKIVFDVWDATRLWKLELSGREREELHVRFDKLPHGPLRALEAGTVQGGSVFLAAIPGQDLAEIYDRWGTRLLEQNVRVFLQARSNVNKGIRRTIENRPDLFFSFNNGITATAEDVVTDSSDSGTLITELRNLQIVNGGQTTASIYSAFKDGKDLSKVYVQMKLSVLPPDKAKELVPEISRYANSQNKVSDADFFSNHEFHVEMERFSRRVLSPAMEGSFIQTKWFYERARGQYRDAQAYLTPANKRKFVAECPKAQYFNKTDLAKYLMVWTDKPYIVNRGAQKNFKQFAEIISAKWESDRSSFNERYFKACIAKKIIFNQTESIVTQREWYRPGLYRSQHVVLTIGYLAHAVRRMGKSVNFDSIWNDQGISLALRRALETAADVAHEVLMDPQTGSGNISEWAKQTGCWDRLSVKKASWNEDFLDELVDLAEEKDASREAKNDQRVVIGIECQTEVVKAGADFWKQLLNWCIKEGEGSEKEIGILRCAASIPRKMPTDKQCEALIKFYQRLKTEGCPLKIEENKKRLGRHHEW
ncbi:AIPR family protein [Paratractidigestivibacter sp.]|uniref:AIPR family protein n=1 Tax=Paratractidigestivibacter sp. TaxID=2847316 RepID=UPI002ABD9338|nr:AIPR family protein [Paratractidigestivibacter sp.]